MKRLPSVLGYVVTLTLVLTSLAAAVGAKSDPAEAAAPPVAVGQFVPAQTMLLHQVVPTPLQKSVTLTGQGTIPASGVSAVEIVVSVSAPYPNTPVPSGAFELFDQAGALVAGFSFLQGHQDSEAFLIPINTSPTFSYSVVNHATVAITIESAGYYSQSVTTGAHYVASVSPTTVINNPQVRTSSTQLAISGSGVNTGVPSSATAVYLNVTVTNWPGSPTNVQKYVDIEGLQFYYDEHEASSLGVIVPIDANGTITIRSQYVVGLVATVIGYFAPGTGNVTPIPAFTTAPSGAPAFSSINVPAGSSGAVQVAGVNGVPTSGSGLIAVEAYVNASSDGVLYAGNPLAPIRTESGISPQSSLEILGVDADGKLQFKNVSTAGAASISITIAGWYTAPSATVHGGQGQTTKSVVLSATPEGLLPGQDQATYRYRIGNQGAFQDIPSGPAGRLKDRDGNAASQPTAMSSGSFMPLTWNVAGTVADSGGSSDSPTLVQVESCYGNSSGIQFCSAASNIILTSTSPTEATASLGPGVLSLASGDYTVSSADAAITTSLGSISVGRTLDTLNPAAASTTAAGVFGPGWRADLAGPDAGEADLQVTDNHTAGYLLFTDPSGSPTIFQQVTATATSITYAAVGDAASLGVSLTMTLVSGSPTTITWVDPDQTKTIWTLTNGVWVPVVQEASANPASTTTKYIYNSSGLVTRILAPTPAGMTTACTDGNADTTPGCRSLTLNYTDANHNCGTTAIRLCSITASVPDTSFRQKQVTVEQYSYNPSGQLIGSLDPRISPNLVTGYDYDANDRLTTVTEPGINPWSFDYDGSHRLSTVTQTVPVTDPGTATTSDQNAITTVVYGVPLSGTDMPNVNAAASATWDEIDDLPISDLGGTAIFSPDHQPASTDPSHVGTADWPYATIHYLDSNDREVNTATYGAGQWLIDTTQYDVYGNVTWTLDAGNRVTALASSNSATQADLLASSVVYNPLDPSEVTDTYGPVHPVRLSSGAVIQARSHAATTYDEGAPYDDLNPATGTAYRLPTTLTTAPYDTATGTDAPAPDKRTDTSSYSAVGSMVGVNTTTHTSTGAAVPFTGWALGQATKTTLGANAGGLSTYHVYDGDGREIRTWLPGDSNGTTPRSTNTTYYTTTGSGSCVSAASAGLVCKTTPAAQPPSGSPLATTTYTYDSFGQVSTTTQLYGTSTDSDPTRISYVYYDDAERPILSSTEHPHAPSDDVLTKQVEIDYDPVTGQVAAKTSTGAGSPTLQSAYDKAGNLVRYTDATGNTTTTGYDIDGRPILQADSAGTTKVGYDSSTEHRGLITSEDIGTATSSGFTATYDAAGHLTETYPGGLTATGTYDNAGNQTRLTYARAGKAILDFTQTLGAANTGDDHIVDQRSSVNGASYSYQTFADDAYGRLTTVTDAQNGPCTTRVYAFNTDSDRTSLNSYPAGPGGGGPCSTATTPITIGYSYDQADRLTSDTTGGTTNTYGYDDFGRTLTLPAGDATGVGSHNPANGGPAGDMTLKYYSNDMVASQAQGGGAAASTITFGLDPDQNRISTEATTTSAGTKTLTNHYDDDSDEPAWTNTLKTDGTTATKRYVDGIDGNLAAIVNDSGAVKLDLTNLHGDIVATIDPTATAISGYHETTEYGTPRDPASAADDYGWVGAKKRSSDDLGGLTLMGVRLYNPATGRFLSVDPVPGGNANSYTYPLDPINDYDLTGAFGWKSILHTVVKVAAVTAWLPGPAGGFSNFIGIGSDISEAIQSHDWSEVAIDGLGLVASTLVGRAADVIADKIATRVGNATVAKFGASLATPKHKKLLIERVTKSSIKDTTGNAAEEFTKRAAKKLRRALKLSSLTKEAILRRAHS